MQRLEVSGAVRPIYGSLGVKRLRKFKFQSNLTTITGTLRQDRYTFPIIYRLFFHGMRSVSDKSCRENQNTHFVFNNFSPKIVPFLR